MLLKDLLVFINIIGDVFFRKTDAYLCDWDVGLLVVHERHKLKRHLWELCVDRGVCAVRLTCVSCTDRCCWCSSQEGSPALRGSWRVSAWRPGYCRTPGTLCTGRVWPRRECAGAWSWLSSPVSAAHRDDTQRVSLLERTGGHKKEDNEGVFTWERASYL